MGSKYRCPLDVIKLAGEVFSYIFSSFANVVQMWPFRQDFYVNL